MYITLFIMYFLNIALIIKCNPLTHLTMVRCLHLFICIYLFTSSVKMPFQTPKSKGQNKAESVTGKGKGIGKSSKQKETLTSECEY